jgi:hypothetical protein
MQLAALHLKKAIANDPHPLRPLHLATANE